MLSKDKFGTRRIDTVKLSDARIWLIQLQQNGRSYSSIHTIRGVLRPAFRMAVDDDLIRKNPFDFELATVVINDSVTREAITAISIHRHKKGLYFGKNRYMTGEFTGDLQGMEKGLL